MRAFIPVLGTMLATSALAVSTPPGLGPHDLLNVSEALLRAYNARDASAFRGLLAPSLQARHSVEDIVLLLGRCRGLTHDIERFSIPSWGARHYGFFGVYAETQVLDMILEIDEDAKIVHWVITDDVTSKEQQCAVNARG
jgi:hypothetical protein